MYRIILFFLIFILISCDNFRNCISIFKADEELYRIFISFEYKENQFDHIWSFSVIDTTKSNVEYYPIAIYANNENFEKLLSEIGRINCLNDEKANDLSILISIIYNDEILERYRLKGKTQMKEFIFKTNEIIGRSVLNPIMLKDFIID